MSLTALLGDQAPALAIGSTVLLGAGLLLGARQSPVQRQRAAEIAVAAAVVFFALALLPLPRPLAGGARAAVATVPAAPSEQRSLAPRDTMVDVPARRAVPVAAGTAAAVVPASVAAPDSTSSAPLPPSVAAPPVAESTVRALPAIPWAACYLLGSAACALWLLLGAWRLRGVVRAARAAPPAIARLAGEGGGGRPPRVLITARACRPFCCGLLQPTIVLPQTLCAQAALPHVLRHELAHIAQRDLWGQALFALALPLLWPQPLFWWLRRRARLAAELIADDRAARGQRTQYAGALLDLVEHDLDASVPAGSIPVFNRLSDLSRRLEMLITRPTPLALRMSRARQGLQLAAACALTVTLAAGLGVRLSGQVATTEQAPPAQDVRAVQQERDRLAAEVASLRQALAELKATLAKRAGGDDAPVTTPVDPAPNAASAAGAPDRDPFGGRSSAVEEVTVRKGDSLEKLVHRQGLPANPEVLAKVLRLNPDLDVTRLTTGQKVLMPRRPAADPVRGGGDRIPTLNDAFPRAGSPDGGEARVPAAAPPAAAGLDVALRLVDAQGALELAEAECAAVEEQVKGGVATPGQANAARVALRTAQRKRALVLEAVKAEIELTAGDLAAHEARLVRAKQLHERGFVARDEVLAAETALRRAQAQHELLRSSLREQPQSSPEAPKSTGDGPKPRLR